MQYESKLLNEISWSKNDIDDDKLQMDKGYWCCMDIIKYHKLFNYVLKFERKRCPFISQP